MAKTGRVAALALLAAFAGCNAAGNGPFVSSRPAIQPGAAARDASRPIDLGRRDARKPVSVILLLRYNHVAELHRFVGRLARSRSPHYLTREQFEMRYAPTREQERRVLAVLSNAGFTVKRTYSNRTLVDATASTATVERFFGTRMHDYRQARYGVRFANATPLHIPAALALTVAAVIADNVIRMRAVSEVAPSSPSVTTGSNVVQNGGFETGRLGPDWFACGSASKKFKPSISTLHPHSGKYDALTGSRSTTSGEPQGMSGICQVVQVPPQATLAGYFYQLSTKHGASQGSQSGQLYDAKTGSLIATLFSTARNHAGWLRKSWNLAKYHGKSAIVFFGVVGVGGKGYLAQYVDDVSLVGVTPSPSPSPSASPGPAYCPSPPGGPTPTPNVGPDGGWGPAAVSDGFCMPSNYGYDGSGQTAAIVIDGTVAPTDLSTYLQEYGVTQTGSVRYVAVDGAAGSDAGEATLDLETIASLAPGADVIVYTVPDLDATTIPDAYNQALSDGQASVVNSSFAGCESTDSNYNATIDAIAVQGAAHGVTFAAAAGDSGADCDTGTFGASSPASDPNFVGVGGTQSTTKVPGGYYCSPPPPATAIANPAVWNDCVGEGGGGVSTIWTPPPFQQGIAGASTSGRNVPDIALPAAYDDSYCADANCSESGWYMVWGTSWATPMYVAMQTELNQACGAHWGINTMYGAFGKSGYADFIDVTSGNNDSTGGGYSAASGFDNVSGIGIPLGAQIARDECGASLARRHRASPRS